MRILVEVTASTLNKRWGAGTSFGIRGSLKKGDQVTAIKEENGWYYLSDASGWISKKYTKAIKNLEPGGAPGKTDPNSSSKVPTSGAGGSTSNMDYATAKKVLGEKAANEMFPQYAKSTQKGVPEDGADYIPLKYTSYNYNVDTTFLDTNLDIIRRNANIKSGPTYKTMTAALHQQFNRYKIAYPDAYLSKSTSYVFFTRPDLNILKSTTGGNVALTDDFKNVGLYYMLFNKNPDLLRGLTSHLTSKHDFNIWLSNQSESFELSDEFIKTVEHGETYTGYKLVYGKNNIESNTAGTFSVSYSDDNYGSVYYTHKAWMEYISMVSRGEASPTVEYIRKKILDYACSAYYFLCGPDGETIIFWAKFFGVFPTSTPSSAFSWAKGSNVKLPNFSINYAYSFKEDANPLSLAEFNMNSRTDLIYKKIYEPMTMSGGQTLSGAPFVDTVKGGIDRYQFKLRFRK